MSTRSDLDAARAYLARMAQASAFSRETTEAIEVLLAATEEPSEGELAREADAYFDANGFGGDSGDVTMYIAGARREGLR